MMKIEQVYTISIEEESEHPSGVIAVYTSWRQAYRGMMKFCEADTLIGCSAHPCDDVYTWRRASDDCVVNFIIEQHTVDDPMTLPQETVF